MTIHKKVDSYRFLDRTTRTLVQNWIKMEKPREYPWTPLSKPLNECTVALVSSAVNALLFVKHIELGPRIIFMLNPGRWKGLHLISLSK